ncbi:sigma-54 dependent transcriptional regulator [bacterium]|nr:sigma-54 dependent transcriptional regulator [bacterium]
MTDARPHILVIDDEESMRHSVGVILDRHGYDVTDAQSGEEGLSAIEEKGPFDVILCDLRMPGIDGLTFVERAIAAGVASPIIMMSAYGSIDAAVEAMRRGAFTFVSKPFKPNAFLATIEKALSHEELVRENRELREEKARQFRFDELVGRDEKMQAVFDQVRRIAPYKTTVLIVGESGTGKELVARSIHASSDRADKPFVAINCGAIPDALLESELFGHVRGAFTDARFERAGLFAEADGGTLFLDEIGEMPTHLQVKLLRALQEEEVRAVGASNPRKVDVRIVAATKQNLDARMRDGHFREDLFYRLSVFPIALPPLRERSGDIPLLVEHFLVTHGKRLGIRAKSVREKAMALLVEYPWPGNVRELENVLERAIVLAQGAPIDATHLPDRVRERLGAPGPGGDGLPVDRGELSIKSNSRELEARLIRMALERTRGNKTNAAKMLEISHRTLLYKIQEYGLGGE